MRKRIGLRHGCSTKPCRSCALSTARDWIVLKIADILEQSIPRSLLQASQPAPPSAQAGHAEDTERWLMDFTGSGPDSDPDLDAKSGIYYGSKAEHALLQAPPPEQSGIISSSLMQTGPLAPLAAVDFDDDHDHHHNGNGRGGIEAA